MKTVFFLTLCLLAASTTLFSAGSATPEDTTGSWPQWRGPLGNGLAPHADPPLTWNETTNIKWKVAIAGSGTASPIVWGEKIFILTAVETDRKGKAASSGQSSRGSRRRSWHGGRQPDDYHQFLVLCLDRKTGKELWRRTACEEVPHEGHHSDHGYASATPVTNGTHLYASFNSRGIFCYDLKGTLKWSCDLGDMETRASFGEGASPALHQDTLLVNWDHEGDSFLIALDALTGKTKWKQDRNERTNWTTPFVTRYEGKTLVVVNGGQRVRCYDFETGKVLWSCGGQTMNVIPTPVATDKLVFCMSGFRGNAVYALPLDAEGDITGTGRIAWSRDSGAPYVPSPLLYNGLLYFTRTNRANLTCVKAETGEPVIENETLPDLRGLYASPVGASGRVYYTGRRGTTVVLENGPKLKVLAVNKLDEPIDASAALAGKQLFLRSHTSLYCIEEK